MSASRLTVVARCHRQVVDVEPRTERPRRRAGRGGVSGDDQRLVQLDGESVVASDDVAPRHGGVLGAVRPP